MRERRQTRSDKYQYQLLEVSVDVEILDQNEASSAVYSEELLDLREKLRLRTRELIVLHCTARQTEVMFLTFDGYTQMEIADILKCNQSSVTKCINGNTDGNKNYGGAIKKIKRICFEDPDMLEIIRQIDEILAV